MELTGTVARNVIEDIQISPMGDSPKSNFPAGHLWIVRAAFVVLAMVWAGIAYFVYWLAG